MPYLAIWTPHLLHCEAMHLDQSFPQDCVVQERLLQGCLHLCRHCTPLNDTCLIGLVFATKFEAKHGKESALTLAVLSSGWPHLIDSIPAGAKLTAQRGSF